MTQLIAGPGMGLPFPQNLYPTDLFNAPIDAPTNLITLSGGDVQVIPAGKFVVNNGSSSFVQFLDPVTGIWRGFGGGRAGQQTIQSDGFSRRVANLTGCPISAVVAGGGTSFTQATATITANVGGSTWMPIVGGSLSISSIIALGANFTIPPIVYIPVPPNPGIQATARAVLTNGTVSAISLTNVGGGYTAATVSALIIPSPADLGTNITIGQVNFGLTNTGLITGALCTNNGNQLATLSALTLTAAGGAGSGATITPVICQTVTAASVVAGGVGFGTATQPALVTSVGGISAATEAVVNPALDLVAFKPRPFQGSGTTNAGGTISAVVIVDNGLFAGTPTSAVIPAGTVPTGAASVTFTMGSLPDTVELQPA